MKIQQPAIHVTEIIVFMTIIMTIVQCDIVHAGGTLCLPMPLCVQASSWRERPGCFGVVPGDRMKMPKRQWRSRRWHHLPDCKGGHLPDICLVFFTGLSSSGFSMYRGSCLEFDTSVFSQQCCCVPSFGNHLQIFVVGVISTFLHTLCACSSWQNVADLGELPQVVYRTRI